MTISFPCQWLYKHYKSLNLKMLKRIFKRVDAIECLRLLKRKYYIYRYKLKSVHPTFIACARCHISEDFIAGAYSYVGPGCSIYPNVQIGKYTMLANDVKILGGDHCYKRAGVPIIFSGRDILKPTLIGDDVWVGAYSLIMAGVKIGNGAIVAAGSTVTKDIPPYTIVGGAPAKFIKMRFDKNEITLHEEMLKKPYEDMKDRTILRAKDLVEITTKSGGVMTR